LSTAYDIQKPNVSASIFTLDKVLSIT